MIVPPGLLVGIPAGILGLAALSRSEVKTTFVAHEKFSPEAFSLSRVGLALVVWLAAGVVLASLGLWLGGGAIWVRRLRRRQGAVRL